MDALGQTSKPLWDCVAVPGGFDTHALSAMLRCAAPEVAARPLDLHIEGEGDRLDFVPAEH